jgi:hypothetical protein
MNTTGTLKGPGKAAPNYAPKGKPENHPGSSAHPTTSKHPADEAEKKPASKGPEATGPKDCIPDSVHRGPDKTQSPDNAPNGSTPPSPAPPAIQGLFATAALKEIPLADLHPAPANEKVYGQIQPTDAHSANVASSEAGMLFAGLVASVTETGIIQPPVVDAFGKILSGHRRVEAAKAAGLSTIKVLKLGSAISDERQQERLVVESNLQRRKTNEVRAREYKVLLENEKLAASGRKAGAKRSKPDSDDVQNLAAPPRSGKARDIAADMVGWSGETARKACEVMDYINSRRKSDPKRADELRELLNEKSVDASYRTMRRFTNADEQPVNSAPERTQKPKAVAEPKPATAESVVVDTTASTSPGSEAGAPQASEPARSDSGPPAPAGPGTPAPGTIDVRALLDLGSRFLRGLKAVDVDNLASLDRDEVLLITEEIANWNRKAAGIGKGGVK